MKKNWLNRAQSISEYAVLLAVIAGALLGMQVYLKRGIQGRIRDLADQISSKHYESKDTESYYETEQKGTTVQDYKDGVARIYQGMLDDGSDDDKKGSTPEAVTRKGHETVYPEEDEE